MPQRIIIIIIVIIIIIIIIVIIYHPLIIHYNFHKTCNLGTDFSTLYLAGTPSNFRTVGMFPITHVKILIHT